MDKPINTVLRSLIKKKIVVTVYFLVLKGRLILLHIDYLKRDAFDKGLDPETINIVSLTYKILTNFQTNQILSSVGLPENQKLTLFATMFACSQFKTFQQFYNNDI